MVLWRLVKRPSLVMNLDGFPAPVKKLPRLTSSYQCQISCASSTISASAAVAPIDYETRGWQEAEDQEGNGVLERNLPQKRGKVVRTVLSDYHPGTKHWLPTPKAVQVSQQKTAEEEAVPEGGSGVLPSITSLGQKTVPRRVRSVHRLSIRHRLWSWEALEFESNVGQDNAFGLQLVDDPKYRDDFWIWVELLRFRQRVYGLQGTVDIWEGIKRRKLILPVRGPQADVLWSSFISLGFVHWEVLDEVHLHARKIFEDTGTAWQEIYKKIVGHLLATDPRQAYRWHSLILPIHRPSPDEVSYLFNQALTSKVALSAFEQIYKEVDVRTGYGTIVPRLCNLELYDTAHQWHYLLIEMGDMPGGSHAVEPLMRHLSLYKSSEQLRDFTRSLVDAHVPFTVSTSLASQGQPIISRESMSRMLGEAHSIAPKSFSDEFCARLFATKAFSVDMVMRGLRMLGMESIGPLSLREIASRDATTEAVAARMDQFRELGLSVGSSIFSKLVRQFAVEGKENMLEELLSSDQHPDALEDRELQETLLASYHAAQDWPRLNSTLAILTCHSKENVVFYEKNVILRCYIRQHNLTAAIKMLEDMRLARVSVSPLSTRLMRDTILRPRKVGRRPVSLAVEFDDLGHLIGLWQGILRCGGHVAPLLWREVFRRLGQTGRLKEFEKLALWLVVWYHPNNAKSLRARYSPYAGIKRRALVPSELSAYNYHHPYRLLFSLVQQEAIIAWGFRTLAEKPPAARPSLESTRSWKWGIKLLLKLKEHGVAVSKDTVRRVIKHRLNILYGPGRSSVPANRLARVNNPDPLRVMLAEIRALWERLFVKTPRSSSAKRRARRRLLTQATGYRADSLIKGS